MAGSDALALTREEVLQVARSYAEHRWTASPRNVLHGSDAGKVDVQTPDQGADGGERNSGHWIVDTENVGVPYQWGGFDSLESFDAGVKAGKAAGDLYTPEKRRKGGAAVSSHAVGVDCSGFISRCWKLKQKYGTSTLTDISKVLASPADLRPGDIMNAEEGHVILFAKWLDDHKSRALFYEAEPFSKVISSERDVADLVASGFRPMRYRQIQD